MISISAFKAFPQIPELALQNGINLEFSGLVERTHYPDDYLQTVRESKYLSLYNSAHGPFFDLIPPSSDSEVSELAKNKFIRAIDACNNLGIKNLILHNGWIPSFYSNSKWIDNSLKFWNSILDYSKESLVIHLENVMETEPLLIKEIITGINSSFFKACLDVGHVNVFSNIKITQWIQELNSSINHVHLHNNYGIEDNHNGLTAGNINIENIYKEIRNTCGNITINLEVRSDIEKSVEMVKEFEEKMA